MPIVYSGRSLPVLPLVAVYRRTLAAYGVLALVLSPVTHTTVLVTRTCSTRNE